MCVVQDLLTVVGGDIFSQGRWGRVHVDNVDLDIV